MKVLLDHDLAKGVCAFSFRWTSRSSHVRQMGWDAPSNGRTIAAADVFEFNVLITADQKMYGEQSPRGVAGLVLLVVSISQAVWSNLPPCIRREIRAAIGAC